MVLIVQRARQDADHHADREDAGGGEDPRPRVRRRRLRDQAVQRQRAPGANQGGQAPLRGGVSRRLFFERRLSRDGTRACASCHQRNRAFTDGRPVAVGILGQTGTRSAPTLVNRGYGRSFFWDGRAATLEEQVLQPIANPIELGLPIEQAVGRLSGADDYRRAFDAAFGREVNATDLSRALASYVRSIVSGNAPFDRYLHGDRTALSEQAQRGLAVFRGKGNCTVCHVGPLLSDEECHNTGVAWKDGVLHDLGRFTVTRKDADRGAFKTPTLREIARTAPYMDDGSIATLEAVIEFYDRGGTPNPFHDPEVRPLGLTREERDALRALLESLTGEATDIK